MLFFLMPSFATFTRAPSALGLRGAAPALRRFEGRRRFGARMAGVQQLPVAALSFDLETTGLDTDTAEVVQLAVIVANSQRGARFQSLVLPERPIDPGAAAVHGFTREVLVEAGARPFGEVWDELDAWLADTVGTERPLVWAAHNGDRYDRPILNRCVRAALGRLPDTIDSQGRATWVDTLPMARHALPSRKWQGRRGPYTLGSLYADATGGETLEGAHDAMADAQALTTVWRWLVDECGAAAGLVEEAPPAQPGASRFQAHLQALAYSAAQPSWLKPSWLGDQPAPAAKRRPAKAGAAKAAAKAAAGGAAAPGRPLTGTSLQDLPGVGAYMEGRLRSKGIETAEDLEALWVERGRDGAKFLGWMKHSMPGCNAITLARLVKGLQSEFGGK